MTGVLVACTIAVVLWIVWQRVERDFKCGYCGQVWTHDDHCPWDIVNKERH